MRSTTAKLATFGAVALLATIVPTVSANAAGTALGDCPSGYFCAWADDDATGARAQWEGDDPWWGDDGMHDNAETIYNNGVEASEDVVAIYYDVNYKGFAFCMNRGEWLDWSMDDNDYDSHLWTSGC